MCGIEILLCCAAGGAAGCCAKHKVDKAGKQKSSKGVKGDGESYTRGSGTKNGNTSRNKGSSKKDGQANDRLRHRLPAYEEYQARYGPSSTTQARQSQSEVHSREKRPESPKGGQMDIEEFERLKQARQNDKLKRLR